MTPFLFLLIGKPYLEVPSGDVWVSAKDLNQACKELPPKARKCYDLVAKNMLLFYHLVKKK